MSEYCSLKAKPRLEVVYTFCTIHVRTMLEMYQDSPIDLKETKNMQNTYYKLYYYIVKSEDFSFFCVGHMKFRTEQNLM